MNLSQYSEADLSVFATIALNSAQASKDAVVRVKSKKIYMHAMGELNKRMDEFYDKIKDIPDTVQSKIVKP